MDDTATIDALCQLGLTQYEAKVYAALIGEEAAPVSRLQRKSGVPSGGVYTALAGLVEKGFAELVLGTKKAYRCVPYAHALQNHQRALEQQLERTRADAEFKMAQARTALERIARTRPEPVKDPTSLGIRLVASKNATAFYRELAATNKESLMCVTAPAIPMLPDEQVRRERPKRKQARFVVDRAIVEDPKTGDRALEHALALGNVRFADNLPMRFTVFDRKVVIIEMVEPDDSWQLLIIPNEAMAQTLAHTFECIWDAATPAEQIKPQARLRKAGA